MKQASILIITLSLFFIFTTPAHAYLDAGTGSMLLQLLLGGLAGLAVILKLFWHKVLGLFGISRAEPEDVNSSDNESFEPLTDICFIKRRA